MLNNLNEDRRAQLLSKSKNADSYAADNQGLGKNRYQRRVHSKVMKSVKELNAIDMNKFFKEDILDVGIKVRGETDEYLVQISFGGILDLLHDQVEKSDGVLNFRLIARALITAFNGENVYIRCSCEDFYYRFGYWTSVKDIITGERQDIPSNITNPTDSKGAGCKHILLVLANNSWLTKVGSVIFNYTNYMQKHYPKLYSTIIYPAIYQKEYEEPVQMDVFDDETEVVTDKDTIDLSNKWAKTRTQFAPGNEYRFTKQEKPLERQLNFDSLMSDTSPTDDN